MLLSTLITFGLPALAPAAEVASAEGFSIRYEKVTTPEKDWKDPDAAGDWLSRFKGKIETKRKIAYRKKVLSPGKYDVWVERGKDDWFYLVVGDQADAEKTRLRAQFKLYQREQGVENLKLDLKLVRKSTKLKFSLLVGKTEGHGNIRILAEKE